MDTALALVTCLALTILVIGIGLALSSAHLTIDRIEFRGTSPSQEARAAMWRGLAPVAFLAVLAGIVEPRLDWGFAEGLVLWAMAAAVAMYGFVNASQVVRSVRRNLTRRWRKVSPALLIVVPILTLALVTSCAVSSRSGALSTRVLCVSAVVIAIDIALRLTAHSARHGDGAKTMSLVILACALGAAPAAMALLLALHQEQETYIVSAAVTTAVAFAYLAERRATDAGRLSLLGACLSACAVAVTMSWWVAPLFLVLLAIAFLPETLSDGRSITNSSVAFRYALAPMALVATVGALHLIERMPELG